MTLQIELDPDVQERLQQEAARRGVDPAECAHTLLKERLAPPLSEKQRSAIALLESWIAEDATDDPEEIRAAEEEWEAFKEALNENRRQTGERILFP